MINGVSEMTGLGQEVINIVLEVVGLVVEAIQEREAVIAIST